MWNEGRKTSNVFIDNIEIPRMIFVNFLGIYLDQHTTWNDNIENIASKISKTHDRYSQHWTSSDGALWS